jgi:hypothetical protein
MLQNLMRILPPASGVLTVRLAGVDGFTGRGSVRYAANDHAFVLTVTLSGVAGRKAEVFANGRSVADVAVTNGRANATFSSSRGDKLPELCDGARIEIRQNGDVVLDGALTRA